MTAKVTWTDMRTRGGASMLDKFARMLERSELNSMDLANKFVAIKMHRATRPSSGPYM